MNVEPSRFFEPKTPKKQVTAPPGGISSNIFSQEPTEEKSPRKVRDHQKSRIFEDDNANEVQRKSVSPGPKTPKPNLNTQNRLFGEEVNKSPRRISDTYKSSVFTAEEQNHVISVPKSPRKKFERNPITGEIIKEAETNEGENVAHQVNGLVPNGLQNGVSNGVTNGYHDEEPHTNGVVQNGIQNGFH